METVLTIDFAASPAVAQLVEVREKSVHIIDEIEFENPLLEKEQDSVVIETKEAAETASPAEQADPIIPQTTNESAEAVLQPPQAFIDFIFNNNTKYELAVLLVPSQNSLSLSMNVPQSDKKALLKIIESELEDTVAFDLEQHFVSFRTIDQSQTRATDSTAITTNSGLQKIQVTLIPKQTVRKALTLCQKAGVEPIAVSTLVAGLEGLFHLAPEQFSKPVAVVAATSAEIAVVIREHGHTVDEQFLPLSIWSDHQQLTLETAKVLGHLATRSGVIPTEILAIGNSIDRAKLGEILKLPIAGIEIDESRSPEEGQAHKRLRLSAFASILPSRAESKFPFPNFREREFAYNGHWRIIADLLRSLTPYLIAVALSGIVILGIIYGLRNYAIEKLQGVVRQQVSSVIKKDLTKGQELNQLQTEIQTLEEQLNTLGAVSGINSLETLSLLTQDLNISGAVYTRLSIKEGKIELKGSTTDNRPQKLINDIEKKLSERTINSKKVFCSVKGSTSASSVGTRGGTSSAEIKVEVKLCE